MGRRARSSRTGTSTSTITITARHDHEHDHDTTHDHDHGHGARRTITGTRTSTRLTDRAQLAAGAGREDALLRRLQRLAGDMTIAALLDLGVPLLGRRARGRGAAARRVPPAPRARAPERHRGDARSTCTSRASSPSAPTARSTHARRSALSIPRTALARRIFRRLGEAEAEVHKMPLDDVHFHEVGAVDAIVDIVGAAAAFQWLGAEVVLAAPMGRGFVKARHGILPLPPPAVVECLRGVPTYGVDLDAELVTPPARPSSPPSRRASSAGRRSRPSAWAGAAGSASCPIGRTCCASCSATRDAARAAGRARRTSVVEANVDDMTGELAAHAIEALLAAGALDAWATPITMKKGRPAPHARGARARASAPTRSPRCMLRETTSIGVRRIPVTRIERPRRIDRGGDRVRPHPGEDERGPLRPAAVIKPEFDACARAARDARRHRARSDRRRARGGVAPRVNRHRVNSPFSAPLLPPCRRRGSRWRSSPPCHAR